jgi:hypothetical protein
MERSNGGRDERARLLKHELIDKLAVVVGNCDLLSIEMKAGSACAKRLDSIRHAAREMAKEISKPQFPLWETILSASDRRATPLSPILRADSHTAEHFRLDEGNSASYGSWDKNRSTLGIVTENTTA